MREKLVQIFKDFYYKRKARLQFHHLDIKSETLNFKLQIDNLTLLLD